MEIIMAQDIFTYIGTILIAYQIAAKLILLPLFAYADMYHRSKGIIRIINNVTKRKILNKRPIADVIEVIGGILFISLGIILILSFTVIMIPIKIVGIILLTANRILSGYCHKITKTTETEKRNLPQLEEDFPFLALLGIVFVTVGFILKLLD
jgi:hypothetical protein